MSSSLRRNALGTAGVISVVLGFQVAKYKRVTRRRFVMGDGPDTGTAEFSRLVSAMTGAPVRHGNRVEIMRNGATLHAMVEEIASAKATIDCSSYIYWPGETADRFSEAFIERARAGVEVNLVLDGYGSAKLDEGHLERLREGGVNVSIFRPPRWYALKKLNNRMHRRIMIVDGVLAFAGGVGIADVWTGNAQDPERWRETHLRIEGPAVLDLFGAFLENWTEATGGILAGSHVSEIEPFDDGVALQVTRSTPTGGATAATELFYTAIAGAQRRLWLTTAYFAPDRTFEDAVGEAARGRWTSASWSTVGKWTRGGPSGRPALLRQAARSGRSDLRVRQDDAPAKVLIVDDRWANVGSGNLDSRSLHLDLEVNVAVLDTELVQELSSRFLEDLEVSQRLTGRPGSSVLSANGRASWRPN